MFNRKLVSELIDKNKRLECEVADMKYLAYSRYGTAWKELYEDAIDRNKSFRKIRRLSEYSISELDAEIKRHQKINCHGEEFTYLGLECCVTDVVVKSPTNDTPVRITYDYILEGEKLSDSMSWACFTNLT